MSAQVQRPSPSPAIPTPPHAARAVAPHSVRRRAWLQTPGLWVVVACVIVAVVLVARTYTLTTAVLLGIFALVAATSLIRPSIHA